MTVLSYLPQCIFLIPFSYLTLQVGLNVTFIISLLKSVFFAYVYITKQYIIWLCFGFELKKNLDLAFLHAIFCFEIHPCCSFSHCTLFPVRIVLQPTQSFSCDGPLGLQFGDISSAEVNSLKHVFQYVYIRASLKYIFGSGIASQRRQLEVEQGCFQGLCANVCRSPAFFMYSAHLLLSYLITQEV